VPCHFGAAPPRVPRSSSGRRVAHAHALPAPVIGELSDTHEGRGVDGRTRLSRRRRLARAQTHTPPPRRRCGGGGSWRAAPVEIHAPADDVCSMRRERLAPRASHAAAPEAQRTHSTG
jgi:hypothetical protein